jgi:hypothetical protein
LMIHTLFEPTNVGVCILFARSGMSFPNGVEAGLVLMFVIFVEPTNVGVYRCNINVGVCVSFLCRVRDEDYRLTTTSCPEANKASCR